MAERDVNIKIGVDTGDAQKSLGQLESEFEQLNEAIREVPRGSAEFKKLQKQLTATGREIKNVELAFESLDNEQVASEIGSVAGAVGDVSAAFILLGDDSEEMQEVAKNIEQALGVSMAFKGAIEGVSSATKLLNNSQKAQNVLRAIGNALNLDGLKASIAKTTAEGAEATATTATTGAITAKTIATRALNIAMNAIPFVAIITGIVLLIAYFDKVKAAVMVAVDWLQEMYYKFQNLGTGIKIAIAIIFPFIGALWAVAEAMEYLGVIESEEEKRAREAAEAQRKLVEEKIKSIKKEYNERKKAIDQAKWDLEQLRKAEQQAFNDKIEEIDWEIEKRKAAGEDTKKLEREKLETIINATIAEIEMKQALIKVLADETEERNKANLEIAKAKGKNVKDMEKAYRNELNNVKEFKDEEYLTLLDNLDKQRQALELFDIEQSTKRKENNSKELEEQKKHWEQLERVRKDIANISLEQKEDESKKFVLSTQLMIGEQIRLEHERIEAEKQARLEEFNQRVDNAESLISALDNLNQKSLEAQLNMAGDNEEKKNQIRKKAFARDKALKLAQATIDGIRSVQAALTIPPPLGFALAAINGATAAAQIAAIASAKFEGTTGDSSGGNLPNTSRATGGANIGQVQNTTTVIGEPTKVYVTEQDISDTQGRVRVAESQASL